MKKFIKRVNLSEQWRNEENKLLPVVKKILSEGIDELIDFYNKGKIKNSKNAYSINFIKKIKIK